jgi:hypothetical protein
VYELAEAQERLTRHYHVIENAVGEAHGYRDEVFPSRRRALMAAKERAGWLAAVAGLRVESLVGTGRYFITTGRPGDAGRLMRWKTATSQNASQLVMGLCWSS